MPAACLPVVLAAGVTRALAAHPLSGEWVTCAIPPPFSGPDEQCSFPCRHLPPVGFVFVAVCRTRSPLGSCRRLPCHRLVCVVCCAFTFRPAVHLESVFVFDCFSGNARGRGRERPLSHGALGTEPCAGSIGVPSPTPGPPPCLIQLRDGRMCQEMACTWGAAGWLDVTLSLIPTVPRQRQMHRQAGRTSICVSLPGTLLSLSPAFSTPYRPSSPRGPPRALPLNPLHWETVSAHARAPRHPRLPV